MTIGFYLSCSFVNPAKPITESSYPHATRMVFSHRDHMIDGVVLLGHVGGWITTLPAESTQDPLPHPQVAVLVLQDCADKRVSSVLRCPRKERKRIEHRLFPGKQIWPLRSHANPDVLFPIFVERDD